MHARRQARNHVKSLERLGYKVTIETIDPATGEILAATARPPHQEPGDADAPPGAAARPAERYFRTSTRY